MSTSLARIPPAGWELHRDTITFLYIVENRTLQGPEGVIETMRTCHGFPASKSQYERQLTKWNLRKNQKKGKWANIAKVYARRRREGKDSDVYINDILVEPTKLHKEMGRHSVPVSEQYTQASSPGALEGITICTPPARVTTPCFPGRMFELPFDCFEDSLYSQGLAKHPTFANTPQSLSFETRLPHDDNAPWLFFESPSEATSLLEVLHPTVSEQTLGAHHEVVPSLDELSSMLKALRLSSGIESQWGEQLDLISSYETFNSALTRMLLFSVANNFVGLGKFPIEKVLGWLRSHSDTGLLQSLQYTQGPESEAFAENLFRAAIESGDAPIVQVLLQKGLDPNRLVCTVDGRRYTPVERSSKLRNTEITKLLIIARADVNKTMEARHDTMASNVETGALNCAIGMFGPLETRYFPDAGLVRLLLNAGAKVELPALSSAITLQADPASLRLLAISCGKQRKPYPRFFHGLPVLAGLMRNYDTTTALELVKFFVQTGAYADEELRDYHYEPHYGIGWITALDAAAELGNLELAMFLLDCGASLTKMTLSLAVRGTNIDLVRLLLSSGAGVDGFGEFKNLGDTHDHVTTPLAEAIRCRDVQILKLLEEKGAWSLIEKGSQFRPALLAAAELGEISIVQKMLKTKAGSKGENLGEALYYAICEHQEEIAVMLIDAGAHVNYTSRQRVSAMPLSSALQNRNLKLVRLLLNADVDVRGESTKHVLVPAVEWGDYSIVSDLIAMGADVNSESHREEMITPLAVAVQRRDFKMVQLLLSAGAHDRCNTYFKDKTTALKEAVMSSDVEMINYLFSHDVGPDDSWALLAAVTHRMEMLGPLLIAFAKRYPGGKSGFGSLALQQAIKEENHIAFEKLLQFGIDVNGFVNGQTPLSVGIAKDQGKNLTIVQSLLNAGGNPNSIVKQSLYRTYNTSASPQETALLVAIKTKSIDMVRLLIHAGADFSRPATMRVKRTPLQQAAEIGSFDIVQLLLENGCLENDKPAMRGGATALQLAAIGGYVGIADLLLKRGTNVNEASGKVNGRTALEGAAEHGRLDMVGLLLNAGAEIDGSGREHYERALQLAEENGHIATRNYLERFFFTRLLDN